MKNGEKPCDACTRAKAEYDKRRRDAPEHKRRSRLAAKAQGKATTRLRAAHPEEWRTLYAAALAEVYDEEETS